MAAVGTLMVSPLPVMLPGYQPVDAPPSDDAFNVEPPLIWIELELDELLKTPQPGAFSVEPFVMLKVPVVHTHVELETPPPAIAVAETGTVIIP
jgi:hypothetical protein